MIDLDGYRLNVGIILLNKDKRVFWGKRKGDDAWQFPQGGIFDNEDADAAMFRELNEELGLEKNTVQIIAKTDNWLYYDVPSIYKRSGSHGTYRGQKQIWYLLQFLGHDYQINLKHHIEEEFDAWRWIDYWQPIDEVVKFKQNVYDKALHELSQYIDKHI